MQLNIDHTIATSEQVTNEVPLAATSTDSTAFDLLDIPADNTSVSESAVNVCKEIIQESPLPLFFVQQTRK